MPPVAAVATAVMSAAGTAVSAVASAVAAAPLTAAGLGVGTYQVVKSTQLAEEARTEAAKIRSQAGRQAAQELEFMEKQAGEYYQLSGQQMELQAQAASIQTLANLITKARQPAAPAAPQVFTLPAAKEYSAVEQINLAIDKMFRG